MKNNKKEFKKIIHISIAFILLLLFLMVITTNHRKLAREKLVAEHFFNQIPIPSTLTRLDYKIDGGYYKHNKKCIIYGISAVYTSDQNFGELLEKSEELLTKSRWEAYITNENFEKYYAIFNYGQTFLLDISSYPIGERFLNEDFQNKKNTLFYVLLTYYNPSYLQCSG